MFILQTCVILMFLNNSRILQSLITKFNYNYKYLFNVDMPLMFILRKELPSSTDFMALYVLVILNILYISSNIV